MGSDSDNGPCENDETSDVESRAYSPEKRVVIQSTNVYSPPTAKKELLHLLEKNIHGMMIPPAEQLIKKSMVPIEEAKTGASIAFEKI